jgi:hypothetical protein
MKAILFDKARTRSEMEIETPTETVTQIAVDGTTNAVFKITYSLSMYDNKRRPVYVEDSRETATAKEALAAKGGN